MKKHKPSTARRSNSRLPQAERQENLKNKEEHEHEYQR